MIKMICFENDFCLVLGENVLWAVGGGCFSLLPGYSGDVLKLQTRPPLVFCFVFS